MGKPGIEIHLHLSHLHLNMTDDLEAAIEAAIRQVALKLHRRDEERVNGHRVEPLTAVENARA